jgi:hypothetical protein
MDEESFDRLSVAVNRLREKATWRGTLGRVLGGSLAAISGQLTEDAGPKKRSGSSKNTRNKNGGGFGGTFGSSKDCCCSKCRSGRCWSDRNGRKRCGGRTCQADWGCCRSSGVSVCVPRSYPICCGNQSFANVYTC